MRRFERIHDVVEPIEEYRAGGYHPVHLGDYFNQRYVIIAKLAYGQYSTVWLANDQRLQRHVVLKILKANSSKNSEELNILLHLSNPSLEHPGSKHVLKLLDHFELDGPNGIHLCLVLPVMMSDGVSMTVRDIPRQSSYVRAISQQILLGLDFLHATGIIHGDLQPANIMFTVEGAKSSEMPLQEPEYIPVRWLEGIKVDNTAPRYLMTSQRLRGALDDVDSSTLLVKIGDMGGATWKVRRGKWPVTPAGLRAPELISRDHWDSNIDIWTLGCLIFQLATNEPLFPVGTFGATVEQIDKEHERLVREMIDDGHQVCGGFGAYLSERLPHDFGVQNTRLLTSFLRSMLQRNPEARKTTTELLQHPFLTTKSGTQRQEMYEQQ